MISNLSAWDREKFKEYLSKTVQYTDLYSAPSERKDLNDHTDQRMNEILEERKSLIPEEAVSNISKGRVNKVKHDRNRLHKISNKGDTFNQSDIDSIKLILSNHRKFRNAIHKGESTDNNKRKPSLLSSYRKAFETNTVDKEKSNGLLAKEDNVLNCDTKSTQTMKNKESLSRHKRFNRANQTTAINTKNASISTDTSMTKKLVEEYVKLNKPSIRKLVYPLNTRLETIESPKSPNCEIVKNLTKMSSSAPTLTFCAQSLSDEDDAKCKNDPKPDPHKNDNIDNKSCNSLSNMDDMTVVSNPTSKYPSINDILENFGKRISGNIVKPTVEVGSFWDNPLLGTHKFENEELLALMKQPAKTASNATKQAKGDTLEINNTERKKTNIPSKTNKEKTKITKVGKVIQNKKEKTRISLGDAKADKKASNTNPKSKSRNMTTKAGTQNAPKKINTLSNTFPSSKIGNNQMKFVKTYYLNPYDDLIKSHLSNSDRRLKSVGAKNQSEIKIEGPVTTHHENNSKSPINYQQPVLYKCIIRSKCKENLEKCINFLKETFPQSYLQVRCKKTNP